MNILITGAAKRLGKYLTQYFAERGHNIILHCNRSISEAQALQQALIERYPSQQFYLYCHDLSNMGSIDNMMQEVFELAGGVDLLINNAAMFEYDIAGEFATSTALDQVHTNAIAPMALARDFIRLTQSAQPVVIQILDNKIDSLNPDYFSYTISKTALHAFTQMCGMLPKQGEKAYGIAPSMLLESGAPTVGKVDALTKINPLQQRILLSAIAEAAEFLSRGILCSGEVIYVDGGQTLMNLPRDVAFLDLAEEQQ